jgi:NitT/TauT family transport system substrate-binding protein
MHQLNPTMDLETFAEVADVQKPFIETDATRRNGLGTMSRERWETLIGQIKDLGDISHRPKNASGCCSSLWQK